MITIKDNVFHINTPNSSYIFAALPTGHLATLHYGKRIDEQSDYKFIFPEQGSGYGTSVFVEKDNRKVWPDSLDAETSFVGRGDYREPMFVISDGNDDCISQLLFDSWHMEEDFVIPQLPNTLNKQQTLCVVLKDNTRNLQIKMYYSVFPDSDVIVKSCCVTNFGTQDLWLTRAMSSQIDLPDEGWIVDTLDGAWARERYINTRPLQDGVTLIDSKRGISSNTHNSYVVLRRDDSTYDNGDAYGINLVYSGNHAEILEKTPLGNVRILNGINPFDFRWQLRAGESFYTPESTVCYSSHGTNGLTQQYHRFINDNVVRGTWQYKPRPILVNNWEATYFDFTEKKLLEIARTAKDLGAELFVLDDGWFSNRTNDTRGLGDWTVNKKRLPDGLKGLAEKIKKTGLLFGVWVEPEMVNPDSDLYRKHPEWAVKNSRYEPCLSRNQLLLDFCNDDVCQYIIDSMTEVFSSADISYVKWDFNRPMSDFTSQAISNQGEFFHRYMLGLYRVLDTLTKRFPDILFESCASGGNRADMGMLCYMPQFWASDNTDNFDRVRIQEGTLTCYPQSTMGAHVSASPNHQTFRSTSIDNRFNTACIGAFGYELDLSALNRVDKNAVRQQIEWYKKYRNTLQFGTYYRLKGIFDHGKSSWMVVNRDKTQAVINVTNGVAVTIPPQEKLVTKGLDDHAHYLVSTRQQSFNVKTFGSMINHISPVKIRQDGKLHDILDNNFAVKSEVQKLTVSGNVLNNCGIRLNRQWSSTGYDEKTRIMLDFGSRLYTVDKL